MQLSTDIKFQNSLSPQKKTLYPLSSHSPFPSSPPHSLATTSLISVFIDLPIRDFSGHFMKISLQNTESKLCASNAGGVGWIPGWGTKIPHAAGRGQKQNQKLTKPFIMQFSFCSKLHNTFKKFHIPRPASFRQLQ